MSQVEPHDGEREQRLDAIIAEYYHWFEAEGSHDQNAFIQRHSDFAPELKEFFADTRLLSVEERFTTRDLTLATNINDTLGAEQTAAGLLPRYVGEYEILEELGVGGMGVVFKARQIGLNRVVALKMIRSVELANTTDVKRFKAEAKAAAKLQHSGIVSVHEVGIHAGHYFYTMDYVEGGNLSLLHRDEPVQSKHAVLLVQQLAEAIYYAHQQGIVHRDLKPANILLTAEGVPRITDFGLAKYFRADDESYSQTMTETGQILGTAGYMSPEQAGGKSCFVGPLSDVYSLGAVLYTLLTCRAPFVGETPAHTILQVLRNEPIPPRKLNPSIPRDLETICLKCLEKEPHQRYATAQQLADDLQRFREGRPVLARHLSRPARAWRWCRRFPGMAGLSATVAIGLLVGTMISMYFANEAGRRADENLRLALLESEARQAAELLRTQSEANASLVRRHLYGAHMNLAQFEWNAGRVGSVLNLLNQHVPLEGDEDLRGFEWYYWQRCCENELRSFNGHTSFVASVAFSSDGASIVSAAHDRTVRIWNASTGELLRSLVGHTDAVRCAVFSPSSAIVASGSWDGTVRLWDAATGIEQHVLVGHVGRVESVAFSPDGKTLASAGRDGMIRMWDVVSGECLSKLGGAGTFSCSVAFSADGLQLVSTHSRFAKIWDVKSGVEIRTLAGHVGRVMLAAFSPDQTAIATAGYDGTLKLWDASTGLVRQTFTGHEGAVNWVCFNPDGARLASASSDTTIRIWDVSTAGEQLKLQGHTSYVAGIAFSPDGMRVASAGWDHKVKLWDATRSQEFTILGESASIARCVRFCPDGVTLVSGSDDGTIRQWNMESKSAISTAKGHQGIVTCVDVSPDGKWIASSGADHAVKLWYTAGGGLQRSLGGHTSSVEYVRFSPDGAWLVSASADQTLKIWNVKTGDLVRTLEGHSGKVLGAVFSADGFLIASASADHTLKIWEAATGKTLQTLNGHTQSVESVGFAPSDARLVSGGLVSGSIDQTVRKWDLTQGKELLRLSGHAAGIYAVSISPDGKRIAAASGDGTVKLWDSVTGMEMLTLKGQSRHLYDLDFSFNGMRIAASNYDGTIQVWNASEDNLDAAVQD
jgi:WD40 repeat protein/serine/threonine protein kinase